MSYCCSKNSVCVSLPFFCQIGDRVGPVGTGESNPSFGTAGFAQRLSPVNWSMAPNRQEALVSRVAAMSSGENIMS